MADRSDAVNCWAIRRLGTGYQARLSETTNVASFYGPISDIHGQLRFWDTRRREFKACCAQSADPLSCLS